MTVVLKKRKRRLKSLEQSIQCLKMSEEKVDSKRCGQELGSNTAYCSDCFMVKYEEMQQ